MENKQEWKEMDYEKIKEFASALSNKGKIMPRMANFGGANCPKIPGIDMAMQNFGTLPQESSSRITNKITLPRASSKDGNLVTNKSDNNKDGNLVKDKSDNNKDGNLVTDESDDNERKIMPRVTNVGGTDSPKQPGYDIACEMQNFQTLPQDSSSGITIETTLPIVSRVMDVIFTSFSFVMYLYDVISDCILAGEYFIHDRFWPFWLTFGLIVFPTVVLNVMSARWFYNKYRGTRPVCHWYTKIVCSFPLMMAFPVRYMDIIVKSIKPVDRETIKSLQHNITILQLFEAFLESIPQIILQVHLILTENKQDVDPTTVTIRTASVLGSLIGASWSLVCYYRSNRGKQEDTPVLNSADSTELEAMANENDQREQHERISNNGKDCKTKIGVWVIFGLEYAGNFLWKLFELGPRVAIIAVCASRFKYWFVIPCIIHALAMMLWIVLLKVEHNHKSNIAKLGYYLAMGYMMTFCFINAKHGRSRYRALIYYTVFYAENFTMLLIWLAYTSNEFSELILIHYVIITLIVIGCFFQILFQMLYYLKCHPKRHEIWVSLKGNISE